MTRVTPTYNRNYHANWHPLLIRYTNAPSDNNHISLKGKSDSAEETFYGNIKYL